MRRSGRRTAYRIAGFYALSFAAASLLLGAATWSFASRSLRHALDQRLQNELSTLLGAVAREGREALIADIIARDAVPGAGGYLLVDKDDQRVAGSVRTATPRPGLTDVTLHARHGQTEPGRAATVRLADGETLSVIGEAGSLARIERTLLAISGAGFGLMVGIGVAGGFLIGRSIHRRLGAVDATARAIIDGDLMRRMPIGSRDDEFARLAATLNRMLDHIGQLMDSLRHVSDDIAHDLRTPIARLRATLETAGDAADDTCRRNGIAEALGQVDGLIALFATILRISEVERGGVRSHFGRLRLDLIATDLVEAYAPAALDAGRSIEALVAPRVYVRGDEALLGQAIGNLLENAIKHTPAGTRIRVVVAGVDGQPSLVVSDDGPGVPAGERATVIRRFGRREASRTTAGYGLGLTLVAAIAATHRAELVLGDAAPGLMVSLIFPHEG
jgi:signal transduction histidine kinase